MQRSSGSMSARRHRTTQFHKHVPVSEAAKRAVNAVTSALRAMKERRARSEFYASIRELFDAENRRRR